MMGKPFVVSQNGIKILIDPDDPNRILKPMIKYRLSPEEIEARYGHIKSNGRAKPIVPGGLEEYWKRKEQEKKGENEVMSKGKRLKISIEEILEVCREYGTGKLAYKAMAKKFSIAVSTAANQITLKGIRDILANEKTVEPQKAVEVVGEAVEEEKKATKQPLPEEQKQEEITNAQLSDPVEEEAKPEIVDQLIKKLIDDINSPAHYTFGTIEVTDYIQDKLTLEEFEGFCKGVILQYVSRCRLKGGLDDLKKAAWYLDRIIKVKEAS